MALWLSSPSVVSDLVFKAMAAAKISLYDNSKNQPQMPAGADGIQ
jgi:hypothetical protein